MENLVVIAVIALIVGLAVAYVIKEKKKGVNFFPNYYLIQNSN